MGESQFGKSSFINMTSGGNTQKVGSGDGKSCTSQVTAVPFQDVLGIFQINAPLCFLDIPGFNDTSLALSNEQILGSIKFYLAEKKYTQLDAVFVFQSAFESALRLAKLFDTVESLFGGTIVRSCVIIATKSDLVSARLLPRRRETIEGFAREKNVPVVWWVNDSDEPVSIEDKRNQASCLNAALARVQPYNFSDMQEFERRIQQKAQELMRADPSNTVVTRVQVPYEVSVPYNENETYFERVNRRKYTDQQVWDWARHLQSLPQNKEPYNQSVKVVEAVKKYQTYTDQERIVWTKWFLFFSWEEVGYRPVQRVREYYENQEKWVNEVRYRDRPLEYFAAPFRNETVVVDEQRVRTVQRWRKEQRFKTEHVTTRRTDWHPYRRKAVETLVSQLAKTTRT